LASSAPAQERGPREKVSQWSTSVCCRMPLPYSAGTRRARHLEAPGPVEAATLPESRVREVAAPHLTSTATFPATARQVTAAPTGGQLLLAARTAMAADLLKKVNQA